MRRLATTLSMLLLLGLATQPADAQVTFEDVTINQLNALPQANIDQLIAHGAALTPAQVQELVTNDYAAPSAGACRDPQPPATCTFVRIEAVVISDPRYSGLASVIEGIPNRIHFYVRDVAAETQGAAGMTIQVVDDTQSGQSLPLRPGDVVEIEGFVLIFGSGAQRVWQFTPYDGASIDVLHSIDPNLGWLQPVTVSTSDVNMVVTVDGEPLVQANWAAFNDFNGQFVRFEGVQITNSDQNEQFGRPRFAFSSVGDDERVVSYDMSLRYRNQCSGGPCHEVYPNPPFFSRSPDDPFIAPPPGAIANVQGFLVFGPIADFFNVGQPPRAFWYVTPVTDADLELDTSPPVIAVENLTAVPTGPFNVYAIVQQGGTPVTAITLHWEFSTGASGSVGMTPADGDNRFVGTIPATAAEDGAFVTYYVHAEDAGGLENQSSPRNTRVLFDGITQIEHIQRTASGGQGQSPFTNITTDMNIEGIIMTHPGIPTVITIQDDPEVNPWTGVFIMPTEAISAQLNRGDRIRITHATIRDGAGAPAHNMTRLQVSIDDIEVLATGQELYPPVTGIPTGLIAQDPNVAEQYEGMWMRFDDVVITNPNPDAPSTFGEFAFSSDGTEQNQLRARTGVATDASAALPPGHDMWQGGELVEYIQGVLSFSFSNWKLLPETEEDIGPFVKSTDGGVTTRTVTIDGAYPNPVTSSALIAYTLANSGHVRLELFDVTGRRVAVLVDADQAAGEQRVALDAGSLASGLYIVRLAADGDVQTTRVVVAR